MVYLFKLVRHLNAEDPSSIVTGVNNNVIIEDNVTNDNDENLDHDGETDISRKNITVRILISKMSRLATFEALKESKETIKVRPKRILFNSSSFGILELPLQLVRCQKKNLFWTADILEK